MKSPTHPRACKAMRHHPSCPGGQDQNRPAASRARAEEMLRDMAYVLHLTDRLKADILAGQSCRDAVLV